MCAVFVSFLSFCKLSLVYHASTKRLQELSAEDGMRSSFRLGHGSSRSLIQKGTVVS